MKVFGTMVLIGVCCVLVQARRNSKNCDKQPICGTNGVTYKSLCDLADARQRDPDIEILFEGACLDYRKYLLGDFENLRRGRRSKQFDSAPPRIQSYPFQ